MVAGPADPPMSVPRDEFDRAVRLYLDGDLAAAEPLFERIVAREGARRADGLHLWGLIALRTGGAALVEARLSAAIAADPEKAAYHGNLASAIKEQGRLDDAVVHYRQALAIDPAYRPELANLGLTLIAAGKPGEAIEVFRRLLDLDPGNAEAHFGMGSAREAAGEEAGATAAYREAIRLRPDYLAAHNNLGNLLVERGAAGEACTALERACRLAPNDARIRINLGNACGAAGRYDAARSAYRAALRLDAGSVAALANLAALSRREGDDAGTLALFHRLLTLDPERAESHADLALHHESRGREAEARTAAKRALALDPDNVAAGRTLALLAAADGDLEAARGRLEALLARAEDPLSAIELGRVLDRSGAYEEAFEAFVRGNRGLAAKREAAAHSMQSYPETVRRNRAALTAGRLATWPAAPTANGLAEPIFLVGFPRSGTTLTHQILATHPAVETVEELPLLSALEGRVSDFSASGANYPEGLCDLSDEGVAALRQAYWRAAEEAAPAIAGRRLVDKLPLAIVHLGLVRRLFPAAKIVVALRDPRDVVLSCFMQAFEANAATVHFNDLGAAARLYAEVMGLWLELREGAGLDALAFRYEDLVDDPAATVGAICAHLDLDYRDDMLGFHRRRRPVATPSYRDVAEPVYARAAGRWRNYRAQLSGVQAILAPFVAAFGYPDD